MGEDDNLPRSAADAEDGTASWLPAGLSWGGLLVTLLSGLGIGAGLPPLVKLAAGFFLRRGGDAVGRRVQRRIQRRLAQPNPAEHHQPRHPPPEVARTEREYIPYREPSAELIAYRQALADLVQHYPGSADWARAVEAYKEQILAGKGEGVMRDEG